MVEEVNQPDINGGRGASAPLDLTPSMQTGAARSVTSASIPTAESLHKLSYEIDQLVVEARTRIGKIYQNLTGYVHDADTEVESALSSSLSGVLNHIRDETARLHSIINSL